MSSLKASLGGLEGAVRRRLERWRAEGFVERAWRRDGTLWSAEPVPELVDRLGWLRLPETMVTRLREFESFASAARADGLDRTLLLGMGGSSLAPEVFARALGADGGGRLEVLDSTHPDAVRAAAERFAVEPTLVLVSSKSGTTSETMALCRFFWERSGRNGRRFAAVTDPGTPLERVASEGGFRGCFRAPADVGGRFSALGPFGLVPAALVGADLGELVGGAVAMAAACADPEASPGLELGAILGEAAIAGRDKLVLLAGPGLEALPAWLEQLVAESTGKEGTGIVPVDGGPVRPAADALHVGLCLGGDRPHWEEELERLEQAGEPVVRIGLPLASALGAEMYRWEFAVAAAGAALGVQPFDQPDVQAAKIAARRALAGGGAGEAGAPIAVADEARRREGLRVWLGAASPRDYLAVQAFLAPSEESGRALNGLRDALAARTGRPVSWGFGPRFLHSTGQLHKGGPGDGLFLQLVDRPGSDVAVPGEEASFGRLIRAQADGDAEALVERGRRLLRLDLGERPVAALAVLAEGLE